MYTQVRPALQRGSYGIGRRISWRPLSVFGPIVLFLAAVMIFSAPSLGETHPEGRQLQPTLASAAEHGAKGRKHRSWHQFNVLYSDQAAVATIVGYGLHVASKKIAGSLRNHSVVTNEKLERMYKHELETKKTMQKDFKAALEAKDRQMTDLKTANIDKIKESRSQSEKWNNKLKEQLKAARAEIEALKRQIRELEEEITRLKGLVHNTEQDKEELRLHIKHTEDDLTTQLHEREEKYIELQNRYDNATKHAKALKEDLFKANTKIESYDVGPPACGCCGPRCPGKYKGFPSGPGAKPGDGGLPWGEIGMTGGILGMGAAAGLGLGKVALKGRMHDPEMPLEKYEPPPPPPALPPTFDNPFSSGFDRAFDVSPCPCDENPGNWDWKWLLIVILAVILLVDCVVFRLFGYLQGKFDDEDRLSNLRRNVQNYAFESHQNLLERIDEEEDEESKVKSQVLNRIKEVGEVLAECESALAAHREREKRKEEEDLLHKAQRLKLRDALDECLKNSLVPQDKVAGSTEEPEQKEVKVYGFKFLDLLSKMTFEDKEIQEVVDALRDEFKANQTSLDPDAQIVWEGNEFDEIHFYRTHLMHVETREGHQRNSVLPVVPGAEGKRVKDVAAGFEKAAHDDTSEVAGDTQNSQQQRARFSPSERLRVLFQNYMKQMKKEDW